MMKHEWAVPEEKKTVTKIMTNDEIFKELIKFFD